MTNSEKRSHPRFSINQLMEFDYGYEKFTSAIGVNLSRSGVLCLTEDEIELYSKVFMMMTIPLKKKERIISLEGVVVRSKKTKKGWETGVNITAMNSASQKIFDEVIEQFHL